MSHQKDQKLPKSSLESFIIFLLGSFCRTYSHPILTMSSFPYKLHQLLTDIEDNEELSSIISWLPSGTGFRIHKPVVFETFLLTKYFPRQSKLKSFKRQVQYYGFDNLGRGSYSHPSFVRGKRSLCGKIIHKLPMKNAKASKLSSCMNLKPSMGLESRSPPPSVANTALRMPALSNKFPLLPPQAFSMTTVASKVYEPTLVTPLMQATQDACMASYLEQLQRNDMQQRAMQQYIRMYLSR